MEARARPPDERDHYPIHEEDSVPETPYHKEQTTYCYSALRARFPEWFVTGNVCIYWEQGNVSLYRAPDVFVAEGTPSHPDPRVYLTWEDPPILFAAEIGSRSTFRVDEGPKVEIYARHIRAEEYLYANPPQGDLRLWRLGPEGYEPVAAEANGRLRSAVLDLEFGLDESGWLWIYTRDGERLRTHEEAEQLLTEERTRREALERQLAALQAELRQHGT
jgi:Uma2 family endonuclease